MRLDRGSTPLFLPRVFFFSAKKFRRSASSACEGEEPNAALRDTRPKNVLVHPVR